MKKLVLSFLTATAAMTINAAPDYVFFFIGDGMGMGHVAAANLYNSGVLGDSSLLMTQFPWAGMVTTHSASTPVTDSAAAGTALATGHKTRNGMLGVTPDSSAVFSIAHDLQNQGYGIGIVTSVAPDDATPAAFYAHQPARSMFYEIGKDAASSGFDFIAGSSFRGAKDTDLMQIMSQNNVTVATGLDELREARTRRVVLLSPEYDNDNNVGYTIDSIPGALTLTTMTRECLAHLEKNSPDKFFMMVEGGNIDHAAHGNDAGSTIKEIIAFQDAIRVAYDFYKLHPSNTLILVTADHDTGGLTLGNSSIKYNAHLENLLPQRISKGQFSNFCRGILKSRANYAWEDMEDYLREHFGFWDTVKLSDKQTQDLHQAFDDTFQGRNEKTQETLYGNFDQFVAQVFSTLDQVSGIGWTTTSHTGNFVPVYAIGAGASQFAHLIDNTLIPTIISRTQNVH